MGSVESTRMNYDNGFMRIPSYEVIFQATKVCGMYFHSILEHWFENIFIKIIRLKFAVHVSLNIVAWDMIRSEETKRKKLGARRT